MAIALHTLLTRDSPSAALPEVALRPLHKPNYKADNHYGVQQRRKRKLCPPKSNARAVLAAFVILRESNAAWLDAIRRFA